MAKSAMGIIECKCGTRLKLPNSLLHIQGGRHQAWLAEQQTSANGVELTSSTTVGQEAIVTTATEQNGTPLVAEAVGKYPPIDQLPGDLKAALGQMHEETLAPTWRHIAVARSVRAIFHSKHWLRGEVECPYGTVVDFLNAYKIPIEPPMRARG